MPDYTQDKRAMALTTPLGANVLNVTAFYGKEGLSRLFQFSIDVLAENRQEIAFDKVIGQKISLSLFHGDGKTKRFFSGICSRISQAGRDATFTTYSLEMVPQFWLLTHREQCRIFQNESVKEILQKVLTGLDVKFELQGTFEPRDYCVQYRESDFAFASRLMEEEGIYYYFKHTDGGHTMVVANSPVSHAELAPAKITYEELSGGNRTGEMRILRWEKCQELRSGKVTLYDHCFELPHQHLDAERPTQESVAAGKVTHKLKLPANDALELYDYPGAYAQRFDGVDRGGGDQPANLQKIFQDNKRMVAIRMEQEAVSAITISGNSNCRHLSSGHKFTLERHFNADGPYVLTSVDHVARVNSDYRSGGADEFVYENTFTCIPFALPYRPEQKVAKPLISGPQTAVVVGPPGEIIFCDKYGRVKVQFHWDRAGKKDANSSCWLRASQNWAGATWGGMFLPHVGHEVIVEFEEGDPDRPIITGRVYNAECMPPLALPANKTKSVIRDHGGNEMIWEGAPGKQQIRLYCPHHETTFHMGNSFNLFTTSDFINKNLGNTVWETVGNFSETIGGDVKKQVLKNVSELYIGWEHKTCLGWFTTILIGWKVDMIGGNKTELIKGSQIKLHKGKLMEVKGDQKFEKCPFWLKALGKVYYKTKQWTNQIVGAYCQRVSAKAFNKAASYEAKIESSCGWDADTFEWKSNQFLAKAEKWESRGNKFKAKASNAEVIAKMDVNNGTLVIKK